jgi:hypothetical protein
VWVGFAALLFAFPIATQPCSAGASVGVRYGWADVSDEVFEGSGDLGGCNLAGIHLELDLLPLITVEVAGEYVSQSFEFSDGMFAGIKAAGSGEYEDLTLYVSGRLKVLSLVVLPLQCYVGGGFNVHYVDLTIDDDFEPVVTSAVPGGAVGAEALSAGEPVGRMTACAGWQDDLEDAVADVAGKTTRVGWHLLAGLRLLFPGVPISVFVEGRYADVFGENVPKATALYGGASLDL